MTERLPPMPEPLAPEERALAARLARLGPHGEPSPALDARILAAARAELSMPASRAKPVRWPLTLGIAASVLLAVGLAWQLRPLPEPVVYDEAAVSAAASAPEADMQADDAVASAPATTAAPAEPSSPAAFGRAAAPEREAAAEQARAADAQAGNAASEPRPARYRAPPAPPAPAPPPVVLQSPPVVAPEAGVAADMATLPAPPPAPATQAAKAAAPAAPTSTQAMARDAAARRAQSAAAAAESSAAEARAAEMTAQDTYAEEPFVEDVPPATADSPSVRDAWLHRIRELQAAGDTEAARASLQEFVRRYPDVPLPEDLRPLLD